MSHGENAERKGHAGKEYWKSRLHSHGEIPGRFTKKLTHKKERLRGQNKLMTILDDASFLRKERA